MPIPAAALFGRRMRLQIGPVVFDDPFKVRPGGRAAPLLGEPEALRVSFKVRKKIATKATATPGAEPPTLELAIYNLAERTRRQLDELVGTPARGIALDAGYRDEVGTIFRGEVVMITSGREGTEMVTRVVGKTGHQLGQAIVNTTLPPGSTMVERVQQLIQAMQRDNPGVNFGRAIQRFQARDMPGALDQLTRGVTLTGRALDQYRVLSKDLKLETWVDDDEGVALMPTEVRGDRMVVLTAASGLLGPPTRIIDEKDPSKVIARMSSLLQWRIGLGGAVELGSISLSGFYRVRAIVHTGDTHEVEWSTEAEGVQLSVAFDPLLRRAFESQLEGVPVGERA